MKDFLFPPVWTVGEPGNGNRTLWQCPVGCRVPGVDYSGQNSTVQFPGGLQWHIKAGHADATTFHQSAECFEPWRVRIVESDLHDGTRGLVLRTVGGTPNDTAPRNAMVVRKFDAVNWERGIELHWLLHVMPTSDGFAGAADALEHQFANMELRGTRVVTGKPPQIFGLYFWGTKGLGIIYRQRAADEETLRLYFPRVIAQPDAWHRVSIILRATEKEHAWEARVAVRAPDLIFDWRTPHAQRLRGVMSIDMLALGDERPNNDDGGTFLWEPLRMWVKMNGVTERNSQ